MGPRAGLDGRKISPHRDSIPVPSSPWSVAIPTELPGPQNVDLCTLKIPRNCLRNKEINILRQYFLLWGPMANSTGKKLQESESGIEF